MGDNEPMPQAPGDAGSPLGDRPTPDRDPGLGDRLARTASTTSTRILARTQSARERFRSFDRVVLATARYHRRSVGRQSTVVTYAAYFLAFPLLVMYLLVLSWLFHESPRSNDFTVRLLGLPEGTNLGDLLGSTYDTSFDALVGFVGVVGVVLAAAATASDFRAGTDMIFGLTSPKRSLLRAPALDFSAGIWLAAVVMMSWILALGTLARRGTVVDITGERIPGLAVLAFKIGTLGASVLLLGLMVNLALRRVRGRIDRRTRIVGSLAAGAFVVACNFTLLYLMMLILADPNGGGGFALALLLLLWVSVVIRGIMWVLCWMSVYIPDTDSEPEAETGGEPAGTRPATVRPAAAPAPDSTLTEP